MNKIALITGATAGIGKACATKFASAKGVIKHDDLTEPEGWEQNYRGSNSKIKFLWKGHN